MVLTVLFLTLVFLLVTLMVMGSYLFLKVSVYTVLALWEIRPEKRFTSLIWSFYCRPDLLTPKGQEFRLKLLRAYWRFILVAALFLFVIVMLVWLTDARGGQVPRQ
jgi:hypothetical protein